MKGNIKEIVAKITPDTPLEEFALYCDTADDFNEVFAEYIKFNKERRIRLGKFIAYILRHKPDAIGITLDKHGWADVTELIDGINRAGKSITNDILDEIVERDEKRRFSFNEDKTKIRANQGHSIDVDLELSELVPPDILYHGTATKYLDGIKEHGILKRNRNYVHLSINEQTATKVGARHGAPVVLKIDTARMTKDGYKFYLSANGVWLTDYVPFKFVVEVISIKV